MPALVAVAHGSRDPRSAATIAELAAEVRAQRPDLDVRVAFLDLSAPRMPDVLDGVAADGHRTAVVVPLLLGDAFHARTDVPGAVADAARRRPRLHLSIADVLGRDPGVDTAALHRLHAGLTRAADRSSAVAAHRRSTGVAGRHLTSQAMRDLRGRDNPCELGPAGCPGGDGCVLRDPGLGVVLASVGSSRETANRAVAERVERWRERFGWAGASGAYVTAAEPTPAQAIDAVRAKGARRVAVVPWVLAPGRLPDRIAAAADDAGAALAEPLGPHPALAATVVRRWAAAVSSATGVRQVG